MELASDSDVPKIRELHHCYFCDGETRWILRQGRELEFKPGRKLKTDLVLIDRPKVLVVQPKGMLGFDMSGGLDELPRWLFDRYKKLFGDEYPPEPFRTGNTDGFEWDEKNGWIPLPPDPVPDWFDVNRLAVASANGRVLLSERARTFNKRSE